MKRLFSIIFIFFLFLISYAQLDTEHWFAPMVDRVNNPNTYQTLYLSTNETTPFTVTIYNNNTVIGTKTISKGNPQKFDIPNREQIITTLDSKVFTPNTMGLYCKAEKKFFANLRFSILNHGEIITAKGKAGLGTKFYASMAPLSVNNGILNFMTSILATEDNTQVTISGYNASVQFSNGTSSSTLSFTLNNGQSYIIDGKGNVPANWDGFIGAKIESDKPICVTNGNFNGQYAGNFATSSDIMMDQSVPVDKLGNEFALVKGNGNIGNNMEGAIIVATENNTQVFLNNSATPVTTLQEGKYYKVPETNYINQGNGHYNLYIKTSKNAYVYQLMAGDSGSSTVATGGFNYIPPLNCYLPKSIDEIGLINENYVVSNNNLSGILNIPTKLNIITEKGATITVNGTTPSATNGPFNITGTNNWVSYSIPNVSGNVTINSTKATTAGISAGTDAVGYGGYFAGFSSVPLITKVSGTCIPDVVLEVPAGYDSYEWYEANDPTTILSTTNTYNPLANGSYYVKVKTGSCEAVTTPVFTDQFCVLTSSFASYNVCKTQIKITPQFSLYTSETVNPSSVNIVTPPTKGTVTINSTTGEITYNLNAGQTGSDFFVYNFSNGQPTPKYETVTVNLNLVNLKVNEATLKACKINGIGTFNLTTANITSNTYSSIKYFPTLLDASTNNPSAEILNPTAYTSTTEKAIYARVKTAEGCEDIAKINLQFYVYPILNINAYNANPCDVEVDGVINVDFSEVTRAIVSNYSSFTIKYYLNSADANAGNTNTLPTNWSYTTDTPVYVRIESPDGCPPIITTINFGFAPKVAMTSTSLSTSVCDNNLSGSKAITLSDYISLFTADSAVSVSFYASLADAQNQTGAIALNQTITANKTYYIRFSKTGVCPNIGTLNLAFSQPAPSATLPASLVICQGSTTTLNAGTGYASYLWSNGATTQTITVGTGNYWVDLTSSNGCVYRQSVSITDSPKPIWNLSAYNANQCDDNVDGTIAVNFASITPLIITNASLFTVKYYLSATDAAAGNANTLPANWSFSSDTTVYVRAESSICPAEIKQIEFKFAPKVSLSSATLSTTVCDNTLSGSKAITLSDYASLFTADSSVSVTFHASLADAQNQTGAIALNPTLSSNKTYYIRFSKTGVCPNIGTLNLAFSQPVPSTTLPASLVICQGATTTLDPGTGYASYLWSNGATTQTINVGIGNYWVDLTSSNGCVYRQSVSITDSPKPIWNLSAYNATQCDDNVDGTIAVNFASITPLIITNASLFTVKYYLSAADAAAGNSNTLPANWSFSSDTTVYVRAESSICPAEIKQIDFKFAPKVALSSSTLSTTVCDNTLSGSKAITLSDYVSLFTADSAVSVSFYASLADAQNQTGAIALNQTITANKTYYIRFSKTGVCPNIGTLNLAFSQPTPSTTLPASLVICEGSTTTLDPGTGYSAYLWSNGATTQTVNVGTGNYWVDLTSSNGCVYRQSVSITDSPKPIWNLSAYNANQCDDNVDGTIAVNFASITPIIVSNASLFTVKYYLSATDAAAGNSNTLPANWSFSADTTVYVRVESSICPAEIKLIAFKFGNKLSLNTSTFADVICDNNLDNVKTVNLNNYKTNFTQNSSVIATYYTSLSNAQNKINPISSNVNVTVTSTSYYIRFEGTGGCPTIAVINLSIKQPTASTVLKDKIICPNTTTTVDAGASFDSYVWSNGATTQTATYGAGNHYVDLFSNGCVYRQNFSITTSVLPIITDIIISGNTITVNVSGGFPPYLYSLDGNTYQSGNTFTNVSRGIHTLYVIDSRNCTPVNKEFFIINLVNAITPNDDGYNDVLDYSILRIKKEVKISIYDRFGNIVSKEENTQKYIWDGKIKGRPIPTGTYWYTLEWTEPDTNVKISYQGWILVKNRN